MQAGGIRAAVSHCQPNQDVVGRRLGVLGDHVPVAITLENRCVGKLELGFMPAAAAALLAQRLVRKFNLWVLVERLEVRVSRRGVEIEVNLLNVLGVVALRIRQSK